MPIAMQKRAKLDESLVYESAGICEIGGVF
jgi:hypothetical protein